MSQQDDAFVRTFIMVLAALIVFTISVFVLAQIIGGSANTQALEPAAVSERTKPIGEVKVASAEDAAATTEAAAEKSGKEIYDTACMACHNTGAAGAPKVGDNAAWAPRIAKGTDVLLNSALNGFNAMPPRGGNPSLSDEEIKKTVDYMLSTVQAAEQPAPAEAAPAPEATPPAEQPAPAEAAPAQ